MLVDFFRKHKLIGTLALCALTMPGADLFGDAYVGIFGGGGDTSKTHVTQRGFAFRYDSALDALSVVARGKSGNFSSGMGGLHVGYEFCASKYLRPAIEFETFYLSSCGGETTGILDNPTYFEHSFVDTFPLRMVTFFGHGILAVHIPCVKWLEPYVGGGIGGAAVWIAHARSEQDSPAEPGINHFNSKPSASSGAFAAQFKAGLRFNIHRRWRIFAEYRYLFIASTSYIFGFTQYATAEHAPTSNWIVHFHPLNYNLGVIGLEYRF